MKNQLAAERAARAGSAAGGASNEVSIATFEALKTAMNECDKDVKKSISCNENVSAEEIAKQKEAPTAGSDFIFTFFADDYLHFVFNLQILQINVNDLL